MINSTPSIFSCWRMETSFKIGLGDVPPPISPPFHPKQKVYQKYLSEADSAMHKPSISLSSQAFLVRQ